MRGDFWLIMHILLVVAAYAALFFMALSAVAYLIQERRLKWAGEVRCWNVFHLLATLDAMLSKVARVRLSGVSDPWFGLQHHVGALIYLPASWMRNPNIVISITDVGSGWLVMLFLRFSKPLLAWAQSRCMALVVLGCVLLTWVTHARLEAVLAP